MSSDAAPAARRESGLLGDKVVVLMTSVGNEAVHGFVPDLRRRAPGWELVGVDARRNAAGLYVCDSFYEVPERDSPGFLPTLRRICRNHGVDVVLPLSTLDQEYFAAPEIGAELGVRAVVVSPPQAVRRANRKIELHRVLEEASEMLPEYEVVDDPAAAVAALRRLAERHGAAVLKADQGTGAAGILCVGAPPEGRGRADEQPWWPLSTVVSLAQGGGDGLRFPSPLSHLLDEPAAEDWPRLAVAYLPGDEYSVDVLADAGETLSGAVRLRQAATGGLATVAVTVEAPDVWEAATRVIATVGLSYVNNVQFRRDADGVPKIMDLNPRIPGTISLTVESGLNLPLAACCMALGEPLELPQPEIGVYVLRHFGNVFTRSLAGALHLD